MRIRSLAACAAGLVALVAASPALGDAIDKSRPTKATYAIIGDTPYGTPQINNFPDDVAQINADPAVTRVVHLGDIKNGSTVCSTDFFNLIRSDFDGFSDPLVYTPGDNEWTDCHRSNNGAYWPAGPVLNGDTRPARLQEIRRIFFDHPGRTLGQHPASVEVQSADFPENVLWSEAGVGWGVLNVPGSNNDWLPWFGRPQTASQIDEVTDRTAADIEWMHRIFVRARNDHDDAVAIGIQADMWDPSFAGDPTQYDHFTPIVRALAREAHAFHGTVLLLNGDSHRFTDDHPLDGSDPQNLSMYGLDTPVPNLRRITVNGSTTPCHEYLRLTADTATAGVFSVARVRFRHQPGFDPALCPATP